MLATGWRFIVKAWERALTNRPSISHLHICGPHTTELTDGCGQQSSARAAARPLRSGYKSKVRHIRSHWYKPLPSAARGSTRGGRRHKWISHELNAQLLELLYTSPYLTMGNFISFIKQAYPPKPTWEVDDIPDLTGKVVIVTGVFVSSGCRCKH